MLMVLAVWSVGGRKVLCLRRFLAMSTGNPTRDRRDHGHFYTPAGTGAMCAWISLIGQLKGRGNYGPRRRSSGSVIFILMIALIWDRWAHFAAKL